MWQATSIRTDEEQNISLGKTGVKYDGRKDKNNSNNPHEKIKQTTIKITPTKLKIAISWILFPYERHISRSGAPSDLSWQTSEGPDACKRWKCTGRDRRARTCSISAETGAVVKHN